MGEVDGIQVQLLMSFCCLGDPHVSFTSLRSHFFSWLTDLNRVTKDSEIFEFDSVLNPSNKSIELTYPLNQTSW